MKIFVSFLFSILTYSAVAQLCQGSLGDPLINITFGAGNNPGPALNAAATGYQYSVADCPNDGLYAVRNSTAACFGNSWHSVNSDHTGDPNGYFMIVNASVQPSPFYIDTVRGLCANTTFEFASYILNIILPASCNGNTTQPNITFSIEKTDGTVIQTYNSGNIPPANVPQWQQYGFFFTTPAGVSDVVLRMVNNAPGGCGNDLLLDDITFRPCGPLLLSSAQNQVGDTARICNDQSKTFNYSTAPPPGYTNPVYQWQQKINNGAWQDIAGANNITLQVNYTAGSPTGSFYYRMAAAEAGNIGALPCRTYGNVLGYIVSAIPVAAATNDGPTCIGATATLIATGGVNYSWMGPAGFTANTSVATIPLAQAYNAGNYTVQVTSAAGCVAVANTFLVTQPKPIARITAAKNEICRGDSISLMSDFADHYKWEPANILSNDSLQSITATPTTDTKILLTTKSNNGCTDTASVFIKVFKKAIAEAGPNFTILKGSSVQLQGSASELYATAAWSPIATLVNANSLRPKASPIISTTYQLIITSNNNCGVSTDTCRVDVFDGVFIPNAFTPNGVNKTWNIAGLKAYPDFNLALYNRYGQLVYENKKILKPWDGKYKGQDAVPGVYVYIISYDGGKQVRKGTLLLIR